MATLNKKATFVMFSYSDGSLEYALGDHANEVMAWLNACQTMNCIHGGQYTGPKMIQVPDAEKEITIETF